jgi:hypothetical protein
MVANIQLFQLRLSPEQSGKFIPSSLSRSYSTFPLCSGATLIEIAVCGVVELCKVMTEERVRAKRNHSALIWRASGNIPSKMTRAAVQLILN